MLSESSPNEDLMGLEGLERPKAKLEGVAVGVGVRVMISAAQDSVTAGGDAGTGGLWNPNICERRRTDLDEEVARRDIVAGRLSSVGFSAKGGGEKKREVTMREDGLACELRVYFWTANWGVILKWLQIGGCLCR